MDEDLFDEFGNPIGDVASIDIPAENEWEDNMQDVASDESDRQGLLTNDNFIIDVIQIQEPQSQVVLYEDKKYYPDLEEVYPNAEVMIQEEDTQPISQPLIEPIIESKFDRQISDYQLTFSEEYLAGLMSHGGRSYCMGIVGHLHHGKTSIVDYLIEETHVNLKNTPDFPLRFTDNREDEKLRKLGIKAQPVSLVLQDSRSKSYLFHIFDLPGHPCFIDEVAAGLRICDGVYLVVDVIEGLTVYTEKLLADLVMQDLPIILVVNKIDRLIIEMKLPPGDAYYKIKYTIDQVNQALTGLNSSTKFDPVDDNVIFASGKYGMFFTLKTMAQNYSTLFGDTFDISEFAQRLWGDVYFSDKSRLFTNKPPKGKGYLERTFVEFILEPIYKLMVFTISYEKENLEPILQSYGIYLKKPQYQLDTQDILKIVCATFFGPAFCLREAAVNFFPISTQGIKLQQFYKGERDSQAFALIQKQTSTGPLYAQVVKQYHNLKGKGFFAFARVFSGILHNNSTIQVLGENYSTEDPEDTHQVRIQRLYIYNTQYKIEVNQVPAGNWVLIEGIDEVIQKTATITQIGFSVEIMKPLQFRNESIVKIAVEPYNPKDLPKMLEAIRQCNKSYPLMKCKVEESGEHIIAGTGEIYLDNILHDLRNLYTNIEVKLSEPFISFCETAMETSSFKAFSETSNGQNVIAMLAEPLEMQIGTDIEKLLVNIDQDNLAQLFQKKYKWDILASRNIWAFGPVPNGPNILINDLQPGEGDRDLLNSVRDSVIQGFSWACQEGPLCEEPIRNVKYRIIESNISSEPVLRASGQIIPAVRRVCYSSLLLATPKLMEPYYELEIQCTQDCLESVRMLLQRRRGHVNSEEPKPGSPFYQVRASLPVVDSFGFETDLRTYTSGLAFSLPIFDGWKIVPGDPLDKDIVIRPLEPSPAPYLARDFLIKTRRRKGLADDVSIVKFFDNPKLQELARQDEDLSPYFN